MAVAEVGASTVRYLRDARWLRIAIVVQVLLVAFGLAAGSLGTAQTGAFGRPDAWMITSGVMGVFALIWGLFIVGGLLIVGSIKTHRYLQENPEW